MRTTNALCCQLQKQTVIRRERNNDLARVRSLKDVFPCVQPEPGIRLSLTVATVTSRREDAGY